MDYVVNINREEFKLPFVEVAPGVQIAVFDIMSNYYMYRASINGLFDAIDEFLDGEVFDCIVTSETKGIPLAFGLMDTFREEKMIGKNVITLRKSKKLYSINPISSDVRTITTQQPQQLWLDERGQCFLKGAKVLIVDDVISSGASLDAMKSLVERAGGTVVCSAFVLAEGDSYKRTDVIYLDTIPIRKRVMNV